MSIVFKLLDDGGFVVGDTDTGRTAYAYPTSPFATKAKKSPVNVAKAMMRNVARDGRSSTVIAYDTRNWTKLEREPLPPLTPADIEARRASVPGSKED